MIGTIMYTSCGVEFRINLGKEKKNFFLSAYTNLYTVNWKLIVRNKYGCHSLEVVCNVQLKVCLLSLKTTRYQVI